MEKEGHTLFSARRVRLFRRGKRVCVPFSARREKSVCPSFLQACPRRTLRSVRARRLFGLRKRVCVPLFGRWKKSVCPFFRGACPVFTNVVPALRAAVRGVPDG